MYDPELYRSKEEVEQWKRRDPIALFRARLEAEGQLDSSEFTALDQAAGAATDSAVAFAEAGQWEPVEDLLRDVNATVQP
jgi:pyruvate dehydrogenase E1 component alpha subunit